MGHGNVVISWTRNEVNHWTWECCKMMGHGNVVISWDMGMR